MKLLLIAVLVAFILGFWAAYSFRAAFSEVIYNPLATVAPMPAGSQEEQGGAPRKTPAAVATSSSPNGFRGPSGTPHINGPSGPPPGS